MKRRLLKLDAERGQRRFFCEVGDYPLPLSIRSRDFYSGLARRDQAMRLVGELRGKISERC